MSHRFSLTKRHYRHWWWEVNDHLAALMERLPSGPWADVPPSLASDIRALADALFGDKRFTIVQILREPLPHDLFPLAARGTPTARDPRHAGRSIAEALRTGGWRVWVETGIVKFQRDPSAGTPRAPHPADTVLAPA